MPITPKRLAGSLTVCVLLGAAIALMAPRPAAAASVLNATQSLGPGGQLTSPDGHYVLIMQDDGNLVNYSWPRPLWVSNTAGHPGTDLEMQSDGNLVLYAPGHVAIWSTNTAGNPGAYLAVQNDANVVVIAAGGNRALWASGSVDSRLDAGQRLNPGWQIQSPNRAYRMVMQDDGNLVVYSGSTAVWASRTRKPGTDLEMQDDGNLVLYAPGHLAVWSTNSFSRDSALVAQNDRNFVVYAPGNAAKWSTRTSIGTPANLSGATGLTKCPTMSQGSSGSCVALLQRYLNWAHSSPQLNVDGMFGPLTRQAVTYFQAAHGLTTTGVAGPKTKSALVQANSVQTPNPGHAFPTSLNLGLAATWALNNVNSNFPPDQEKDPCAQFVSRALHAGGLPYEEGRWFPRTAATAVDKYISPDGIVAEWYGVQGLRKYLLGHGWVNQYSIFPGANVYPVGVGDVLYYEWDGVPTAHHVHVALVTRVERGVIYVTDQNSRTSGSANRRWDISGAEKTKGQPLPSIYPAMKAYVLHWNEAGHAYASLALRHTSPR
jgi:hypothetical protein